MLPTPICRPSPSWKSPTPGSVVRCTPAAGGLATPFTSPAGSDIGATQAGGCSRESVRQAPCESPPQTCARRHARAGRAVSWRLQPPIAAA
eukprot:2004966-Prymnesium_polylepis.1